MSKPRHSVNLPKTSFSMKAGLPLRESRFPPTGRCAPLACVPGLLLFMTLLAGISFAGTKESPLRSLVSVRSEKTVVARRRALIDYIWRNRGFPNGIRPARVDWDVRNQPFAVPAGCSRVDRVVVRMECPVGTQTVRFDSIAYHFHPPAPTRRLAVYHAGHDASLEKGMSTVEFFLKNGYAVLAFTMPLFGENSRPVVEVPDVGPLKFVSHDYFHLLESPSFSPFRLFVEPVAVGLNHALAEHPYDEVVMAGISGGGWTTTLYAALDPRVLKSYPVAGSTPSYLKKWRPPGDYEQWWPDLYEIADVLDLYVLGAAGKGRSQLQILNQFDNCCFMGTAYGLYVNEVQAAVGRVGKGRFDVFLDSTHREHIVSAAALEAILRDLRGEPVPHHSFDLVFRGSASAVPASLLDDVSLAATENSQLGFGMAEYFEQTGRPEAAENFYRDRLGRPGTAVFWRTALARFYLRRARYDEAEATASEILRDEPLHLDTLLLLAEISQKRERWKEAEGLYKTVRRLDPLNEAATLGLADVYGITGRPESAYGVLTAVLDLKSSALWARRALADLYVEDGRWEDAARQYRLLLELDPPDAEARIGLAYCLFQSDRRVEADEQLQTARRQQTVLFTLRRQRTALKKAGFLMDFLERGAVHDANSPSPVP